MPQPFGRNIALSLPRRFIGDLVHFAHKVPSVPVQRRMRLGALVRARQQAPHPPSWCALFVKAFALVAARRPEFRRAYLSFPRPHLYEHPISVASIAVERHWEEEEAVFFGHVKHPEIQSLEEIEAQVRMFKDELVENIGAFRRALSISRLPMFARRFVWWFGLNVWGRKRAHYMGTFGISVYGGLGAASLHPLSPLTTTINFGVIQPDGMVDVRFIYDHRVMDGATVARALTDVESVLLGEILAELRAKIALKTG